MPRKRDTEGQDTATLPPPDGTPVEALPDTAGQTVVTEQPPPVVSGNGTPTEAGSSIPVAPKTEPPGEKPFCKFGPYPTSEKRTFLTVAIWRREVQVEGGELVMVYNVGLTRTYYDQAGQPKSSNTLRSVELPLAILLLEKADRYIKDLKEGNGNGGA